MWSIEVEKIEGEVEWEYEATRYGEELARAYGTDWVQVKIYYDGKYVATYYIEIEDEWIEDWNSEMLDMLGISVRDIEDACRKADSEEELIELLEEMTYPKDRDI